MLSMYLGNDALKEYVLLTTHSIGICMYVISKIMPSLAIVS